MSFYTDEDVAELLARDAAKRTELWKDIGTRAYKGRLPDPPGTREVNKRFLHNTILSVETHNRREEIEDCWRQHKLTKRFEKTHKALPVKNVNYEDERAYWAEQKKRKLEEATQAVIDDTAVLEVKKAKKSKKKKKEKSKKKEKKKRKIKSRSRSRDCDDSSISS